ncbi:MAG: nuclease A inhibitor family protein [Polyangiaceae bacterium]
MTPDDTEEALTTAALDLLFPSESEAPIELYKWPLASEPTPAALLAAEGRPADTHVETGTAESEVGPLTKAPPGADDIERGLAARFQTLLETLNSNLFNVRVYRVGRVDIDVYILGRSAAGAWLGYKTHVVET